MLRLSFEGLKSTVSKLFKVEVINHQAKISLHILEGKMDVSMFHQCVKRQNAKIKLRLSDLGVRKKVANSCLRFKGCKAKITLRLMYLKFINNI